MSGKPNFVASKRKSSVTGVNRISINSLLAASLVWVSFVSLLRADSTLSTELIGVKLTDKNQITVDTKIKNLSSQNINIDPRIWVRLASTDGHYYDNPKDLFVMPGIYRDVLTFYANLTTVLPNGVKVSATGNWAGMVDPGNYPPPPIVLTPGGEKDISVVIDMYVLLGRKDLMTILSKDVWIRAAIVQSGEGDKKYFPIETTHDKLYKLLEPREGERSLGLNPLNALF